MVHHAVLEELGILAVGHANGKVRKVLEAHEVASAHACVSRGL
jgi:hypothetical protein